MLFLPLVLQTALFPFAVTLDVQNNTWPCSIGTQGQLPLNSFNVLPVLKPSPITSTSERTGYESTIENQDALLVLYIPVDFSRKVASGREADIQAIVDGRRSNSGQIALGYVESIIQSYNNEQLIQADKSRLPRLFCAIGLTRTSITNSSFYPRLLR